MRISPEIAAFCTLTPSIEQCLLLFSKLKHYEKKYLFLFILGLCSTASVFAQGKVEAFPEFIYLDATDGVADKALLFQKHYKMEASDELQPIKNQTDKLGYTHEKFQQYYKGVKVENSVSTLHSKGANATMITGNYRRITGLEVTPTITLKQLFLRPKRM